MPIFLKFNIKRPCVKLVTSVAVALALFLFTQPRSFAAPLDLTNINNTPWSGTNKFTDLGQLITVVLQNVLTLAAVILMVLLIGGGITYMSGGASGDPKKAAQGQQAITWAVIGFLVVFGSYWILQLVKVITGVDIMNPNI